MIDDWIHIARSDGRAADGLLWVPRDVLSNIVYFLGLELDIRDSDLAAIERDPHTVLR